MQLFRTVVTLCLSLLTLATAQEAGSGAPFITAAPPTAGSIAGIVATTETAKSINGPISQGAASSDVVLSGTRTAAGESSATGGSAGGSQTSDGLVFDTTSPSRSTATAAVGTTVVRTTTAGTTAAGNVAPTTGIGAWQSWLAVMAGGLFVAAGLM